MSSSSLTRAAEVHPPQEGDVRVVSVTATSAATDIEEFKGSWITFHAQTADIYIVFGDSAVEADNTATSGDTRAARIPVDQERSFYYGKEQSFTHVAAETASGTATMRYWKS